MQFAYMRPKMPDKDEFVKDDTTSLEDELSQAEDDLWFLPGLPEEEPDFQLPGLRVEPQEAHIVEDWARAEASCAALLARVSGRLGALDYRLLNGPQGWRQRLALLEATELSWFAGDRIGADRLALWVALRLSGVQEDAAALARIGWAVRRLTGGPGPDDGLMEFLGRHDLETRTDQGVGVSDEAARWNELLEMACDLHPISKACMGYHLWTLVSLGQGRDQIEAAVTAGRIAASDGKGAIFAPLAMGGAGSLRADGPPSARLRRWLDGMEAAILTAMRQLDDIEAWAARAEKVMSPLSGRTPPALRAALAEWPMLSAPMGEKLTGASRPTVQRNLAWMESKGLIREVTGQNRFKMWRAV